jgi:hypothetical protein
MLVNIEWNQLLEQEWDLHLDSLHLRLTDLHFFIFNTVSVSGYSDLSDYLIGNSFLDLHLNISVSFNDPFDYPLNLYNLYLLLNLNYNLFYYYLDWPLYFLNDNIWDWNLHNL